MKQTLLIGGVIMKTAIICGSLVYTGVSIVKRIVTK